MMQEQWKPIDERPDYQVSNFGRVRGPRGIRKLDYSNRGYALLNLRIDGRQRNLLVHRLVAKAFVTNDRACPIVNHIDGDKCNNHADNLEWCTAQENRNHAIKEGLLDHKGQKNPQAKLTEGQVKAIKGKLERGQSQASIAAEFAMTQQTVSDIKTGKSWAHVAA